MAEHLTFGLAVCAIAIFAEGFETVEANFQTSEQAIYYRIQRNGRGGCRKAEKLGPSAPEVVGTLVPFEIKRAS